MGRELEPTGLGRRSLMKKAAAAGAVAWVTPMARASVAAAQNGSGCGGCIESFAIDSNLLAISGTDYEFIQAGITIPTQSCECAGTGPTIELEWVEWYNIFGSPPTEVPPTGDQVWVWERDPYDPTDPVASLAIFNVIVTFDCGGQTLTARLDNVSITFDAGPGPVTVTDAGTLSGDLCP